VNRRTDSKRAGRGAHGGARLRRAGSGVARSLAVAALLATAAACDQESAYTPPPPAEVAVAQPLKGPVTDALELTGNTEAVKSVDLVARVEGFLESIEVEDGASVKKGQLLFVIEPETYQAKVDQAKGELAEHKAFLEKVDAEFTRQSKLAKQDFASQQKVDEARAGRDQVRAQIMQSEANLRSVEIDFNYTQVAAPFDGRISEHLVDVGGLVGASGPTTLATLVQLDPMHVNFTLDERAVLKIKEARRAKGLGLVDLKETEIPVEIGLQTETGYPHRGRIDYIAPTMDSATGTLALRAVFENPDYSLLPGLFVRVRLPLRERADVLQVPERALGFDQAGSYLLVVDGDNKVVQRAVRTGALNDGFRVIEEGLGAEDWVIVDSLQRAVPGAEVAPERTVLQRGAASAAGATTKP
jgi:multidrug efflux system membrane fusion protein